jgi:tRNA A58 N-methylase Trm61
MKPELPSVEVQKEFYETQREEMVKINLQNEFTRLRNEKRVATSKDEDEVDAAKSEIKKIDKQFEIATQTIEVIDEQLAKL